MERFTRGWSGVYSGLSRICSEARSLCRTLVEDLEAAAAQPEAVIRILQAQCLVRLDRREDALRLAKEVLDEQPEEAQLCYRAAQLYALLEKRPYAIVYAEKALEKGLRREWFTTPEFQFLQDNLEFQALLDSSGSEVSN